MRALKNHALSYSDVEVKVREATSNDPWSCPLSLMRELSRATHDYVDYPKLFAMLWKRLADVEHVMHVTKALHLLDFLIRHGSERFVLDVKRRQRDIAALQRYKHYDHNNQDDAKEARAKAKLIHELLANEAKLQSERVAAEKQRLQTDRIGGGGSSSYQLTEDEEAEQELYRQRKRQLKAQRSKQPQSHHDSKDADEEDMDGAEDDEDGGGRRQQHSSSAAHKRPGRRQAEEDDEAEERDELSEEKRHIGAAARKAKPASSNTASSAAAPTAGRLKVATGRAGGDKGGGMAFDPVSEEELEDDATATDGSRDGQQQQRSSRVTKRTVRRKTTSSSVQEAEGDEVTQQLDEQEERTQAQRNTVSAKRPHQPNTAACAPIALSHLSLVCACVAAAVWWYAVAGCGRR